MASHKDRLRPKVMYPSPPTALSKVGESCTRGKSRSHSILADVANDRAARPLNQDVRVDIAGMSIETLIVIEWHYFTPNAAARRLATCGGAPLFEAGVFDGDLLCGFSPP